ncbi:serine hydrolase domain-containing protein [Streptomyces kanamyceticus]|uniref:Class A beta-lactamase-related serine hydrolase n=1 Tax=Streptomyces kanamyceticus TaxID=1967 RepID=A0A5J6GEL7_STRKN|nr:serine hydrolase domain-containing protein [Streptomyces kanamyceticus]QEU94360.1 class A beta-lactamase-related serine hydrolase [Streptomyces kanamyceticus]
MAVRRSRVLGAAAMVTTAMALAAGALAAPASAAAQGDRHEATRRALDGIVAEGVPGVTAQVRDKYGSWDAASGVGDLKRGTPRGEHDRFRVGSITKTFVATVLLQLQAEGRIDLDDAVGKWLPGVVEGHGHDGDRITVRQLLNHTSGIFDYTTDEDFAKKVFSKEFFKHRYDTWTPERLVKLAMRHKPDFEPGTEWKYSNTNYILAGMIIKKVTGNAYGDEIRRRVINPLHLNATTVPGTRATMPRPSSRAYGKLPLDPEAKVYDVTELNPSMGGSAGEIISDSADLNRFYSALLGGRLLPKAELAEMKTVVPVDGRAGGYGLGISEVQLPCEGMLWGHDGGIHGSSSLALTTPDGRHSMALNINGDWAGDVSPAVTAEFCGSEKKA